MLFDVSRLEDTAYNRDFEQALEKAAYDLGKHPQVKGGKGGAGSVNSVTGKDTTKDRQRAYSMCVGNHGPEGMDLGGGLFLRAGAVQMAGFTGFLAVDQSKSCLYSLCQLTRVSRAFVGIVIEVRARLEDALIGGVRRAVGGQSKNDRGGFVGSPVECPLAKGTLYVTYVYIVYTGDD